MANKILGRDHTDETTPTSTSTVTIDNGTANVDVALSNLYKALGTGTPDSTKSLMGNGAWALLQHSKGGTISTPGTYYTTVGAVVPIYQAPAALTITKIVVKSDDSTPTAEIAGDLKFADDIFTGSLANAAVIDVCDTTSGSFEATSSFDDATVPSGKYIYFQFDSAPHADHKRMFIQINFTFD